VLDVVCLRRAKSWWRIVPRVALSLALWGCQNPCDELAERVCRDLEPADCALWVSDATISAGLLPLDDPMSRRQSVAGPRCKTWLTAENYASFTLPTVRARLAGARAAGNPGPGAPRAPTADDGVAALPPAAQYVFFPAALLLVAVATWLAHRKLRKTEPHRDRLWSQH
jgi:hypothetical protein